MKTFRGGSMYENLHLDTDKILACLYVLGFTELINFELDQGPDLQWIMDCWGLLVSEWVSSFLLARQHRSFQWH